jgi:hypothetical protein
MWTTFRFLHSLQRNGADNSAADNIRPFGWDTASEVGFVFRRHHSRWKTHSSRKRSRIYSHWTGEWYQILRDLMSDFSWCSAQSPLDGATGFDPPCWTEEWTPAIHPAIPSICWNSWFQCLIRFPMHCSQLFHPLNWLPACIAMRIHNSR